MSTNDKELSTHSSGIIDLLNFGPSHYTGGSFKHDTAENASAEGRNEFKRCNTYPVDYLAEEPESTDAGIASLLLL